MARAVYVGGWGNGNSLADRVEEELTKHHPEGVTAFTAREAERHHSQVRRAAKGVVAYAHSEGFRHLVGTHPTEIHAFGPPLPTRFRDLVGGTVRKTAHMLRDPETRGPAALYLRSSAAELAAHPRRHIRSLRPIMAFDSVAYGGAAVKEGIRTHFAYTERDEFFRLSEEDEALAKRLGVVTFTLGGYHDQLPLLPGQTLAEYGAAGGFDFTQSPGQSPEPDAHPEPAELSLPEWEYQLAQQ